MATRFGGTRRRARKHFIFTGISGGGSGLGFPGGGGIVPPTNILLGEDGLPVLTEDGKFIFI